MKNKFLLFILLLFAFSAQAQYRYTAAIQKKSYSGVPNTYGCPVRYWKNNQSVAFVKQNRTNSFFCLIDHSDFSNTVPSTPPAPNISVNMVSLATSTYTSPIVDNFTVNDIYIVDDYAFFCGNYIDNSNTSKAFYGYFDINDFSGTSLNIYIHTLDNGPDDAPVTMSKLVAYKDALSYTVVAVGNEKPLLADGCCKIVEVADVLNSTVCKMADMPVGPNLGDKLYVDDIILTASYVVFLGHDCKTTSTVSGYPWFAKGAIGSVVADICDPLLNPNYYLPVLSEANDAVEGVALYDDVFAMSYVHTRNDICYTRMRVIDCATLGNPYSQQFKKPQKENPTEMIYLKNLKTVELLQWVTDSANFVQLDPFATSSYIASMLTPDGREYKTLSPIDGERYISACSGVVYLQDRTAALPHSNQACPSDTLLRVEMIKELPPANYPLQGVAKTITATVNLRQPGMLSLTLDPQCFSVE